MKSSAFNELKESGFGDIRFWIFFTLLLLTTGMAQVIPDDHLRMNIKILIRICFALSCSVIPLRIVTIRKPKDTPKVKIIAQEMAFYLFVFVLLPEINFTDLLK